MHKKRAVISWIMLFSLMLTFILNPILAEASSINKNNKMAANQNIEDNNENEVSIKDNKNLEIEKVILDTTNIDETNVVKNNENKSQRYIIKYKSGQEKAVREKINNKIKTQKENITNTEKNPNKKAKDNIQIKTNIKSLQETKNKRIDVLFSETEINHADLIDELKNEDLYNEIEYIQPDYELNLVSDDTYFSEQWALLPSDVDSNRTNSAIETNVELDEYRTIAAIGVDAVGAWDHSEGEGAVVAVIDTGIDIAHEDLIGNIFTNTLEVPDNGIDDDGNGHIDDVNGWNFYNDTKDVYDEASSSNEQHGTHIAGIIAAEKDNEKGIAGIAPKAKVLPIKVFSEGTAYTSDIINAIEYAQDMGAEIVNCSFGGTDENRALKEAIESSNMLFVCAAGNSSSDINITPIYPAAFDSENILSVASINEDGELSYFSNYGQALVDVAAPGEAIKSTLPNDSYGTLSGTSMSTAFVSAEAALLLKNNLNSNEIKNRIMTSSDKLMSLYDKVESGNIINCNNAVLGIDGATYQVSKNQDGIDNDGLSYEYIPEEDISCVYKLKSFSEATKEEKEAICKFYRIEEDDILKCEENGHSLIASINICVIANIYDLPIKEVEQLKHEYSSLDEGINELNSFKYIENRYDWNKEEKAFLKEELLKGNKIKNVLSAYLASQALNINYEDVLKNESQELKGTTEIKFAKASNTESQELMIENKYSLNYNALPKNTNTSSVDANIQKIEVYQISRYKEETMVRTSSAIRASTDEEMMVRTSSAIRTLSAINANTLVPTINPLSATTSSLESYDFKSIVIDHDKYLTTPFNMNNQNENINLSKGNLQYDINLFNIPGRGDLDLNLSIHYDSQKATLYEKDYDYTVEDYTYKLLQSSIGYAIPVNENYRNLIDDEDTNWDNYTITPIFTDDKIGYERYTSYSSASTGRTQWLYDYEDINFDYDGEIYEEDSSTDYIVKGEEIYFAGPQHLAVKYMGKIIYEPKANIEDEENYTSPDTYIEKTNNLGAGWSFGFPGLEQNCISIDQGKEGYIHLRGGQIYKYQIPFELDNDGDIVGEESPIIIDYGDFEDVKLQHSSSFNNGVENSKYVIRYKNDTSDYFSEDGKYIGTKDRRNNEIKCQYSGGYPSKIIDTIGREINITYNGNNNVVLSQNGGKSITLIKEAAPGYPGDYVLKEVKQMVNGNNYSTTFDYTFDEGEFDYFRKLSSNSKTNVFANINTITLPTGLIKDFDFEKVEVHLGEDGAEEYYRVISRKDNVSGSINNHKTFTYEDDYSGLSQNYDPHEVEDDDNFEYITKVTDANGMVIKYTFNNKHLAVKEQTYDNSGVRVKRVINDYTLDRYLTNQQTTYYEGSASRTSMVSWEYYGTDNGKDGIDDYGNIKSYTDELGHKTEYSYALNYYLTSEIIYLDEENKMYTKYDYYSNLNLEKKRRYYNNELLSIKEYYDEYDAHGNLLKKRFEREDGSEITTNYQYSDLYGNAYLTKVSTTVQDYEGIQETIEEAYTYDLATGNIKTYVDGKNNTTTYNYDDLGRNIQIINPESSDKKINFDDVNNVVTLTLENGHQVKQIYDALGRILKKQELVEETTDSWKTLAEYYYNALSQLEWSKDALGNKTSYEYDLYGRLTKETNPDTTYKVITYSDVDNKMVNINEEQEQVTTYYDKVGNITKVEVIPDKNNPTQVYQTNYQYDYAGNMTYMKDARGNEWHYTYDDLARLINVIDPKNQKTSYEYNHFDLVKKIIQREYDENGNEIKSIEKSKKYDGIGRLIKATDPKGNIEYYKYDGNSNVQSKKDQENQTIDYIYDSMNRVMSQTAKDANGNTDSTITFNYDNLYTNNKINITDSRGLVTYEYFKNGLLKKESYPDNKSINYQYNNNGSLTKITDPFNLTVDYQYDNRNRIDTLTVDGTKVFDYNYYADGMLQGISYPSSVGNVSFTYDDINRLDAVTNGFGSNNSTYSYQYDNNSNVTKVINPMTTIDYQYDELNRLEMITKPDNVIVEMKYDTRGNRKEIQTNTRGSIDYLHKYNKDSQYKYNPWDELSEFTIRGDTYKYEYDYNGLRTQKTTPQKTIKYYNDIAGRTITETDENGNLSAQIIWGHKPLARKINGQYYYYLYNGHGDVIALIDENGNTKNNYQYDEWGNIIEKLETIDNPLKYAGEYYDVESGLYYLRARYYEPTTGRFISKDTYEGSMTNPLSLNLYTYCYNNPMGYIDPSGHLPHPRIDNEYTKVYQNKMKEEIRKSPADDIASVAIGFTPLDIFKDGADFIAGEDLLTGEKHSRWKLGICILAPEFIDQPLKNGKKALKIFNKGTGNSIDELLEIVSHTNQHSKGARWVPGNLKEKLAMEEVLTNPSAGTKVNLKKGMTDPKWHKDDGWVKMTQNVNNVEIHYVWNERLNVFDDFKFK